MKATRVAENGSRSNGGSPNGQNDEGLPALAVLAWLRREDEKDGVTHSDPESEVRRHLELFADTIPH